MATCPNKNSDSWKQLVELRGEEMAYYLWDQYNGEVPEDVLNNVEQIVTTPQKAIQDKINETKSLVRKYNIPVSETDPLLLDSEEANNGYEIKQPDGSWQKITKRVTDRVKAWYKERFGTKKFTEAEKNFNELKKQYGIADRKSVV